SLTRTTEMRYLGQFNEVEVSVPAGSLGPKDLDETIERFHRLHSELYTFDMRWKAVELLTYRVRASSAGAAFELPRVESARSDNPTVALKRTRTCRFDGQEFEPPVYSGSLLLAGHRVKGPAIVEETTTTIVVPPAFVCCVDEERTYLLTRPDASTISTAPNERLTGTR